MGTGNVTGGAVGKISVDTSQLASARGQVQSFATGVSNDLTGINPAIAQTESSMGGLTGATRMLGVALASYLTVSSAQAVVGLATLSARLAGVRQEFQNLTQTTTQESEAMLQSMRKASWGLISDMALIQQANKAILFGVVEDIGDMDRLLLIASARAAAMGVTTEDAFERLVHGIGTLNPIVLRQLGLAISLTDAYEQFARSTGKAADQLTEAEKRQAILNIAYAESADLIEKQAEMGETNAGSLERTKIAADNARAALGGVIEQDVVEGMKALTGVVQGLTGSLKELRESAGGVSVGTALLQFGGWQLPAEKETKALNKELAEARHMLANAEQGLVSLQASAAQGLVDEAQVQRQIALIAQLTAEVNRLGGAVADVGRGGSRGPNLASVSGTVARLTGGGVSDGGFSSEVQAAQVDYWQGIQAIDRQAHSAIQQATEQYGQARASTVAQYEKSIAREAEDFGRQRARAVAQHERQIADIRESAAIREMTAISDLAERIAGLRLDAERRLADATEDFNERRAQQQATYEKRVSELREDGLKSIAKIEETAQRERERALRQHRDTLLNAASRLDARAVAQEMRRFATSNAEQERSQAQALKEAKENLAERLEQEKENHEERMAADQAAFDKRNAREARDLQRRIDAEQAAHEKRLADARAADEKRIADQQAAFDEQIAQEDEDRAIRLARQRQDHSDQLAEMARAQALRIQQINEQQAEQRTKLNDAFKAQLADLGLFNSAWIAQQGRWQTAATRLFNEMWGDWYKTMEAMHKAERELAASMGPHPQPLDFPSLTAPSSMPGGFNPAASTRTVNLASGAIVVNEATRPGDTAEEVLRIFERLAN